MDYMWIAVAFVCGYLARQIKLPPLVGYLAAGFGLHLAGITPDDTLETLSDIGITLLLFTIGLKLDVRSLLKKEIWGTASSHMLMIVLFLIGNSILLGSLGLMYFSDLTLSGAVLVAFALSFSSTVCAVKVLEERAELRSRHGQIAIGILIIQDIAAVVFVTFTTDVLPSIWAIGLLLLPLLRPMIVKLLQYCGHGELLPLAGFFLAYTGGELFELVGLKAQLGALVVAIIISGQPKSEELAKSLFHFKDLFLIGFFLSIGFTALPTVDMIWIALIVSLVLPLKAGLFFVIMTQLKLRGRSSMLAALSLANYSEFGLIVTAASVSFGLLPKEWLVIMALIVSFSFIFSSIINAYAHRIYAHWRSLIKRFEKPERLKEDQLEIPSDASILIVGMGRVGTGAYKTLIERNYKNVWGIELMRSRALEHKQEERNVIVADAEDPLLWETINIEKIEMIMFAIPNHKDIIETLKQLRLVNYTGKLAGIAKYDDNRDKLLSAGIDVVFNFYQKAGVGFAEQALKLMDDNKS